jgi:hypothetical protein
VLQLEPFGKLYGEGYRLAVPHKANIYRDLVIMCIQRRPLVVKVSDVHFLYLGLLWQGQIELDVKGSSGQNVADGIHEDSTNERGIRDESIHTI